LDYFSDILWPEYFAPVGAPGCVGTIGCHNSQDGRSALQLEVGPMPDLAMHTRNYTVAKRFINCVTPESSRLLTKPMSKVDKHGGGDVFDTGSTEETIFLQWFNP